jgi:S1-C subfamily serine protease
MMVRAMAAAEAEAPSVDSGGGVQVPELSDGSRAAAAGIEEGDRIVAVNGVRVQGGSALPLLLQSLSDGQSKAIDVDREGTPTHLDLPGDAVADLVRELEAAAD